MPLYTLTIPHSQSDTHYHLYLLWWWNQRKSRPQDLFSCLFYDSLSFTASCCHCLLLPLPLADTVCHCFLLFSCCAVLCCLNSKERILIALEDTYTRNLKIYVKVFGTSQKWKAFTTPKQHRICIKELDLPLLDLPLVESFTFTYNSPSLPAPLSQLWDDFIKDYVTFRETTQNLHQEAWFTTTLKWGSSNTTLSMSFQ